jgi:hypothetical protein
MSKHYVSLLAAAALLAGTVAASAQTTPAPAPAAPAAMKPAASGAMSGSGMSAKPAPKKAMTHHSSSTAMKKAPAAQGDAAVDALNNQSLQAANSGQSFMPSGGGSAPAPAMKMSAPTSK